MQQDILIVGAVIVLGLLIFGAISFGIFALFRFLEGHDKRQLQNEEHELQESNEGLQQDAGKTVQQ